MKASIIKIEFGTAGASRKIPWRGFIVGGTDGSFAVTRRVLVDGATPGNSWRVTHIPTGRSHHRTDRDKFLDALKCARRMHRIFAKHGVTHSTDIEKIKVVGPDFRKAFG